MSDRINLDDIKLEAVKEALDSAIVVHATHTPSGTKVSTTFDSFDAQHSSRGSMENRAIRALCDKLVEEGTLSKAPRDAQTVFTPLVDLVSCSNEDLIEPLIKGDLFVTPNGWLFAELDGKLWLLAIDVEVRNGIRS